MNWYLNHFLGEGPGIAKDEPQPIGLRLLARTIGREWWELIKLNLLFLIFSLPVVTLPAAYYACVRVSLTMIEDRNVYLWRDFREAFWSRFTTMMFLGAMLAVASGLGFLAVKTYANAALHQIMFAAPLAIAITVSALVPLFAVHLFVAFASASDRPVRQIALAAAFGVLARPLPGILALACVAVLWLAHVVFYPASVLLPVLIIFSLTALVTTFAVREGVQIGLSATSGEREAK